MKNRSKINLTISSEPIKGGERIKLVNSDGMGVSYIYKGGEWTLYTGIQEALIPFIGNKSHMVIYARACVRK